MRQIVLDTETTGLSPQEGHRIIEIGGVELVDRFFTGNNFHQYINPNREIEKKALEIHGITNEFLDDKPVFADVMDDFIKYITGAELIIHNAPFDAEFLNHEFQAANINAKLIDDYATIFDTLAFARKKHPGKKNSLDALCKRYNVDITKRSLHGALLDAQLLAEVYLIMTGGQMNLFGDSVYHPTVASNKKNSTKRTVSDSRPLKVIRASIEENLAHNGKLSAMIGRSANGKCLWENNNFSADNINVQNQFEPE